MWCGLAGRMPHWAVWDLLLSNILDYTVNYLNVVNNWMLVCKWFCKKTPNPAEICLFELSSKANQCVMVKSLLFEILWLVLIDF